MKIGSYAKALVAGAAAGVATLGTAMADDVVTTGEWVGVGLAVLAGLGITYVVPNARTSDVPPAPRL